MKAGEWVRFRVGYFCGELRVAPVRAVLSVAERVDYQLLRDSRLKHICG